MAEIVFGVGMSHGFMVVSSDWEVTRGFGPRMGPLRDHDGEAVTVEEIESRVGNRYADRARPEVWDEQWITVRSAVERLGASLSAASLDAVIVVGDDQFEMFEPTNHPAVLIHSGDQFRTIPIEKTAMVQGIPHSQRRKMVRHGSEYYMEVAHELPSHAALGHTLISQLTEAGFDVAASLGLPNGDGHGFGHAIGVVAKQLMNEDELTPIVPVLMNTYHPPNQPTPKRSVQLGEAIRRAVERLAGDQRVGIVASGGLSHFLTDEVFDRSLLAAFRAGDLDALRQVPPKKLNSGSSEIRNWITVAAACGHLTNTWAEYVPVYRTAYGEGVGLAFAEWS